MSTSITETGYLKIQIDVKLEGVMEKIDADKITVDLLDFFKDKRLDVNGKFQHIRFSTLETEKNYGNSDTTSK